jgi:hypothetical protein
MMQKLVEAAADEGYVSATGSAYATNFLQMNRNWKAFGMHHNLGGGSV